MRKLGIPEEHVFLEKASGKDFQRPAYQQMLRRLKKGDTLFLASLDRSGRNYLEIKAQWQLLTKDVGADIVILDQVLLDTRTHKDLMGTLISDIVLSLLSVFAEQERTHIRARQAEGIIAAKARGVRFGRPDAKLPTNFGEIATKWERGTLPLEEALERCGVSRTTFYKYLAQYKLLHTDGG
jgi:DNA invertase Pin-like site-specific DNA recombinase